MKWFAEHWLEVFQLTLEHLVLSALSIGIALLIAVPLGIWAHGHQRRMAGVTGLTGMLYTVPSLALFALLVPIVGLGKVPTVAGLVMYAQLILVRAVVAGLDTVETDVRDAAIGMGIDRWQILTRIDAPLALPVFIAGVRVATVTVIGIATVGAVIDAGGLGELILQGIQRDFPAMVIVGALAVTALALVADFSLLRFERRVRPWLQPGHGG